MPHPAIWSPTFSGSDGHELTHSFVSLPQRSRDRCLEPARHEGHAGAGQTERSVSSSLPCGTWSPPRLGKGSTSTLSYIPRGPQAQRQSVRICSSLLLMGAAKEPAGGLELRGGHHLLIRGSLRPNSLHLLYLLTAGE